MFVYMLPLFEHFLTSVYPSESRLRTFALVVVIECYDKNIQIKYILDCISIAISQKESRKGINK